MVLATAAAPGAPVAEVPATFADLLAHPAKRVGLADGKLIVAPPVGFDRARRHSRLEFILEGYASARGLGQVAGEAFAIRFSEGHVRMPDASFLRTENLHRVHAAYADAPPALAVGIVPPGSIGTDRGERFVEYEAAGTPGYLLVDPLRPSVELFRLEAGRYRLIPPDAEGKLSFETLPAFWPRSEWLLEDRPPYPLLREILGD